MNRFLLISFLLFSSCVSPAPLYQPDTHVMPGFDENARVQVAANINALSGYGGEIIVTPVRHMFVFGRGTTANTERFTQNYWEFGAGGYLSVGNGVHMEVLGGIGQGSPEGKGRREIESEDSRFPDIETYTYQADHQRIYGQINVGAIVDGDDLMLGAAFRFSQTEYRAFRSTPAGLFNKVDGLYLEPALVIRAPLFGSLFLEGEMGTIIPLRRTNWELFETRRRYGSVGVRYQMGG